MGHDYAQFVVTAFISSEREGWGEVGGTHQDEDPRGLGPK